MQALLLVGLAAGAQVRAAARLRAPPAGPAAFLVISSPERRTIDYMRLPDGELRPLLNRGLGRPQGLAVAGDKLLVADPGNQRIEQFTLGVVSHGGEEHLTVHEDGTSHHTLVRDVEAYSIAAGESLFFTDGVGKFVTKYDFAKKETEVLFDGEDVAEVAAPGGVALDGVQGLLWTNKQMGQASGSLVEADLPTRHITKKAANVDAAYGVCVSNSNVFFTSDAALYAMKRTGGGVVQISDQLAKPRGCAFDTDGTIYLTDEVNGKVYSVPANADTLEATDLVEVASIAQPYGIAYLQYDPSKHVQKSLLERTMEWWYEEGPLA